MREIGSSLHNGVGALSMDGLQRFIEVRRTAQQPIAVKHSLLDLLRFAERPTHPDATA